MIGLFGRDDYSVLGIASILDVEKIPYRRLARLEPCAGELLVVTAPDLSAAEIAAISRQRAVVLSGGVEFARQVFGASNPRLHNGSCSIALNEPIWAARLTQVAGSFGKSALCIPSAPMCCTEDIGRGATLAVFTPSPRPGGVSAPAIARQRGCVWSAVDLGAAFANLLTENYLPDSPRQISPSLSPWVRRQAEATYYAAPSWVRRRVQRRSYSALERRLHSNTERVSEYPIDATGWLLIALVKRLILLAGGVLVRLERWPTPYRAAAALTHDLEPRRYAYGPGLRRLLSEVEAGGHVPAFGLVARASARYLTEACAARLSTHEVFCHGLEHRGENVHGRAQVAATMQTARAELEQQLQRPVRGYRSPRLDRSPDLAWALDRSGFQYDSSYPDVDRENMAHFGRGVRLNLPFRPIIEDEQGRARFSRCLELPLTAPDCIQPLFAGHNVAMLRASVQAKAAFVRDTEGLYVALVHAGVFGDRDADVRAEHLAFVRGQLQQSGFWLAGIGQIADWWRGRDALRLTVRDRDLRIKNTANCPLEGVRVVVEELVGKAVGKTVIPLPPLDVGTEVAVKLPCSTRFPIAWPYASVGAASAPSSTQPAAVSEVRVGPKKGLRA